MSWIRALPCLLMLWSSAAWGATLTWTANREPDLAGYRVYQCSLLPCTKSSGTLLVTLGTGASFNIGTPSITTYYFITAFDSANNESGNSNLATFKPAGAPPPPPPPPAREVTLIVMGNPATGPWGVLGTVDDLRDVMVDLYLDGVLRSTQHTAPYGFPDDNGTTVTPGSFGNGPHTVEFVFKLEGTTTEIGRKSVIVQEGPPGAKVTLTVMGNPATGPWGVLGTVDDPRDVMVDLYLDGVLRSTQHTAPYGFPDDNGTTVTPARFGAGTHTVQFVFKLEGTTTEIGRANVIVQER